MKLPDNLDQNVSKSVIPTRRVAGQLEAALERKARYPFKFPRDSRPLVTSAHTRPMGLFNRPDGAPLWLFDGAHPGKSLRPDTITTRIAAALGVPIRPARNAAL